MGCAELMGMIFLVLFLQTCAWEEQKKGFGEECLTSQECREKELMQCLNGLCVCSPFVSMVYDETMQKCVSRVGEKCGVSTRGDWTVTIPCVEGAICDESIGGGCVCTDDYFRIANGTCLKKRKYLESCRGDFECSKDLRTSKPLVCSEEKNVCICNPSTQFYDNERKQCVTLVGNECAQELANYLNECTDHAACVNGTCQCQEHYAPTRNGRCGLGHGEVCSGAGNRRKNKTCSDLQLVCLNGRCDCRYPLHQYYDNQSRECISLISGPCTLLRNETEQETYTKFGTEAPTSTTTTDPTTPSTSTTTAEPMALESTAPLASLPPQRCTKNAICVDHGFFQSCQCEDGYVQTKSGKCAPGHGSPCEVDECDPITPLYCRNGICRCLDELQVFDASMRKCVGLVGSRCDLNLEYQCVEFCSCIQIGLNLEGKCLCDKYSQEVANRTCVYLH